MGLSDTLRRWRATVIAGVIIAAAVIAACAFMLAPAPESGKLVAIVHDGADTATDLPLSEDARLEVQTDLGRNVVVVENGAVHMEEADCPGGDCMRQHAISKPGEQIICLPHKLWIEIRADGDAQAGAMDEGAVNWGDDGVDTVAR